MNKLLITTLFLILNYFGALAQNKVELNNDSLDIMIGQMIMSGVNDNSYLSFNEPILEDIRNGVVGGVVIFEKNIASKKSSKSLKSLARSLDHMILRPGSLKTYFLYIFKGVAIFLYVW